MPNDPTSAVSIPAYRRHKKPGKEADRAYFNDDKGPAVRELMQQYIAHAEGYYVKNGEPTNEAAIVGVGGIVTAMVTKKAINRVPSLASSVCTYLRTQAGRRRLDG